MHTILHTSSQVSWATLFPKPCHPWPPGWALGLDPSDRVEAQRDRMAHVRTHSNPLAGQRSGLLTLVRHILPYHTTEDINVAKVLPNSPAH